MVRYRKKRMHSDKKEIRKQYRLRHRTKDLDQILEDAIPENFSKLKHQEIDGDLPGLAQHYCVACSFVIHSMC